MAKAYSSNGGWSLVELNLTGYACDGVEEDGGPFNGQWFVVDPKYRPRFLGTNMWLVDAGDYDRSGHSELLFAINGYNRAGYRLFYRNFTQSAEFSFTFH